MTPFEIQMLISNLDFPSVFREFRKYRTNPGTHHRGLLLIRTPVASSRATDKEIDGQTVDHGRSDWLGCGVEFVQMARFKKIGLFTSHLSKQPNLAGLSLYAVFIRVSRDLRLIHDTLCSTPCTLEI